MGEHDDQFRRLDIDAYFASRIWRLYRIDIYRGVTDYDTRRERIAKCIVHFGLEDEWIEGETWRNAFERMYQTKLG